MPFSRSFARSSLFVVLTAVGVLAGAGCPLGSLGSGTVFSSLDATDAVVAGTGKIRIKLANNAGGLIFFSITSSNTAVATIASTATIPGGSLSVDVPYAAVAPGSSTISVTLGDQTRTATVYVVSSIQLAAIQGQGVALQVGANSVLTAFLTNTASSPVTISLSSDNPSVVSVPATMSIPDFNSSGDVPIVGGSAGFAAITATLGSTTQSVVVAVQTTPTITSMSVPRPSLPVGGITSLYFNLSAIVAADTPVTLVSSNPAVMAVPASMVVSAGYSYPSPVTVTALTTGSTVITATLGASTISTAVTVSGAPTVSSFNISGRVQIGSNPVLSLFLDQIVTADTAVTLTSSNPAVMAVPPAITVGAGNLYAATTTTAASLGTTLISLTLGSSVVSTSVTVVANPSFSFIYPDTRLQVGAAGGIQLGFDATPAATTPVIITNSNPAALAIQSSVNVGPNTSYLVIPMIALAAGSTNLTFAAFGDSRTVTIDVITTPVINNFYAQVVPQVGGYGTLFVSVDALVAAPTTITLSQTNPAALTIPPTMVIAPNQLSTTVSIQGLTNAATTITATLGASTPTTIVTPTP